jgi:23S rRNA (guanine745-N1)-methyltransferase
MPTVLACPVCGAALTISATAATCPNTHTFDRARSGYLNLLLAARKQSTEPGDSPAMMQSRRTFLQAGFYDQMSGALNVAVAAVLAEKHAPVVADLGCGEGFFTARLRQALVAAGSAAACYGVDISRPGIRMATAYDRDITWVVASLHHSPFVPKSLDVVSSIFAPIDAADVRRVLRDDAVLVTVTPGPDHLDALRALIYTTVKPHPKTPALMEGEALFERLGATRVRYRVAIDSSAQIMNLLAMTPYYWNISLQTKATVEALSRLDLTVDAYVSLFRPRAFSISV